MLRPVFQKFRACGLRCLHSDSHTLFKQELKKLLLECNHEKAVEYIGKFPDEIGRTPAVLSLFMTATVKPGKRPAVIQYFGHMLSRGKLKPFESLELARMTTCRRKNHLMDYLISTDKIECSEYVGDSLLLMDEKLAMKAYAKARVSDKVLKLLKDKKEYTHMLDYLKETGSEPNYTEVLHNMLMPEMEEIEEVIIGEEGPIAVLWDPRTCPFEEDKDVKDLRTCSIAEDKGYNILSKILTALKERLNLNGPVVLFMAHGDAQGANPNLLKSFEESTAVWVDIASEHVALRLIGLEMMRFARIYKPPACVVLISNNGKLANFLHCLQLWKYKTVLIADESAGSVSRSLENAADYRMEWSDLKKPSGMDFSEPLAHNLLELVQKNGSQHLNDLSDQYQRTYGNRPLILRSREDLSVYLDRYMPGVFVVKITHLCEANPK